jgi:hypothetical protein
LAVVAAGAVVLVFVTGREHGNVKRQRSAMQSATHTFYMGAQLTVTAPGANPIPTITGLQSPPASGGQQGPPPTTPQVPPVDG